MPSLQYFLGFCDQGAEVGAGGCNAVEGGGVGSCVGETGDEKAGVGVDKFADAADVGGNDGQSGGSGFEKDVGHAVSLGGIEEKVKILGREGGKSYITFVVLNRGEAIEKVLIVARVERAKNRGREGFGVEKLYNFPEDIGAFLVGNAGRPEDFERVGFFEVAGGFDGGDERLIVDSEKGFGQAGGGSGFFDDGGVVGEDAGNIASSGGEFFVISAEAAGGRKV